MVQDEGRVIRPPIEQVTSGRVFQPTYAFIAKKMIKGLIVLVLLWFVIFVIFLGLADEFWNEIIVAMWQPLEILNILGWTLTNLIYISAASLVFAIGTVYTIIYVKRIEYSVRGWKGNAMPEIYTKRGIITITKKHVPFRTVTHVQTRRGILDQLLGIGTVQIETAGGSLGPPSSGVIPLLLARSGATNKSEERVEGIRFHEELRDFILLELRHLGKPISEDGMRVPQRRGKRIFTKRTLEAFKEVRDALEASRETGVEH